MKKKKSISKKILSQILTITGLSIPELARETGIKRTTLISIDNMQNQEFSVRIAFQLLKFIKREYNQKTLDKIISSALKEL